MPSSKVQWLKENHDLAGLEKVLRNRTNPDLRINAAQALGSLGDLEAVELLARAALQDPDLEVQRAARRALATLVGAETDTVIATYRHHLSTAGTWEIGGPADQKDEEYLLKDSGAASNTLMVDSSTGGEEMADESVQAPVEDEWDQRNLEGLIAVLSHETNPKIRLQAINALQNSSNMRAIEALSTIALYDENEEISQAAQAALEKRFGEDANSIIDSYRKSGEDEEEYAEVEEVENEEPAEPEEIFPDPAAAGPSRSPSNSQYNPSPVIQEDRIGWRVILLALLAILIIGGIAFLLLSR